MDELSRVISLNKKIKTYTAVCSCYILLINYCIMIIKHILYYDKWFSVVKILKIFMVVDIAL